MDRWGTDIELLHAVLGIVAYGFEIQRHPLGERHLVKDVEDQIFRDREACHHPSCERSSGTYPTPRERIFVDAFASDIIASIRIRPACGSVEADQGLRQLGLTLPWTPATA